MTWVDDTLADFGRSLGLPGLARDTSGVVQLALGEDGILGIHPVTRDGRDEIVVFMGRPVDDVREARMIHALTLAHFSNAAPLAVQVALRGSGREGLILAAVRLPDREFTLNRLAHAIEFLDRWLDQVFAGGARRG